MGFQWLSTGTLGFYISFWSKCFSWSHLDHCRFQRLLPTMVFEWCFWKTNRNVVFLCSYGFWRVHNSSSSWTNSFSMRPVWVTWRKRGFDVGQGVITPKQRHNIFVSWRSKPFLTVLAIFNSLETRQTHCISPKRVLLTYSHSTTYKTPGKTQQDPR